MRRTQRPGLLGQAIGALLTYPSVTRSVAGGRADDCVWPPPRSARGSPAGRGEFSPACPELAQSSLRDQLDCGSWGSFGSLLHVRTVTVPYGSFGYEV